MHSFIKLSNKQKKNSGLFVKATLARVVGRMVLDFASDIVTGPPDHKFSLNLRWF